MDNIRFDTRSSSCSHEVRRTERGGEVTWHGPGQIVGYPVLDLNYHKKDLHWYLRQLEEVSTARGETTESAQPRNQRYSKVAVSVGRTIAAPRGH